MYIWLKAFHVIFMVTWFAGLFYLPRLFVYHALCDDETGNARFKIMERKLYYGIMAPAAFLTIGAGIWLAALRGWDWVASAQWLQLKLGLVALLIGYHFYLGALRADYAADQNRHGDVFYRWLNEAPVIALLSIVVLAVVKPWSG